VSRCEGFSEIPQCQDPGLSSNSQPIRHGLLGPLLRYQTDAVSGVHHQDETFYRSHPVELASTASGALAGRQE
jgi:hypothetical protein